MVPFVRIVDHRGVLDAWRRPLAIWTVAVAVLGIAAATVVDGPAPLLTASATDETPDTDDHDRFAPGRGVPTSSSSTTTSSPSTTVPATHPPATDAPTTTVPVATSYTTLPPRPEGWEPEHCIPGTYVRGNCTHKPWAVEGRVTDRTGRPIAGICLLSAHGATITTTDADGRYHVDVPHMAPQPDRWTDCTGDELGWKEHWAWLQPVPAATSTYDVVLEQFAGMTGTIVDVDGAPVAGACVGGSRTGTDGRFRVGGIEPGDRPVTAMASDCPIQYLSVPEETYHFESGEWTEVRIRVTLVGQVPPPGWLPRG